jgi:DOPA 4,5-dioxygenase
LFWQARVSGTIYRGGLFLPWLMLNRDGLNILLHPGTGDAYADHIDRAVRLGSVLPLRMKRKSQKTPSHS